MLWVLVLAAVVAAKPALAQESATAPDKKWVVDADKAKKGAAVFSSKACVACHTIGNGRLAGPDLAGLLERRDVGWVQRWLRDPDTMLENDSTAKALLEEYSDLRMPNMKLTEEEIERLVHYIVEEGQKLKRK